MRLAMVMMMASAAAVTAAPGEAQNASAPTAIKQETVDGIAVANQVRQFVRDNYVVAEKKAALDAALAKGIASGRYTGVDGDELASRITADLFAVAQDKHLGIRHDPAFAAQIGAVPQNDELAESAAFKAFARAHNHGVTELRMLDANIRYLAYNGFAWTGAESAAAIDTAMAFLKEGDAVIIDLRRNGGGSPEAVRHLASYFLPANTKLITFHLRNDPPTESISESIPPANQLTGKPVYVLTSGGSASAAEEFVSHVSTFGFGELVGEPTAGAAYRNETYAIPGGYVLSVSIGRPETVKGGNWEGKGIAPTIATPADQALERAQQAALTKLATTAPAGRRGELQWYAEGYAAQLAKVQPTLPLASYVGSYGPRKVTVEGDRLRYVRQGGIQTTLIPMGPNLFALEADRDARIRFVAENGKVTGLEIVRIDGSKTLNPRT